jgi:hypothetical protein
MTTQLSILDRRPDLQPVTFRPVGWTGLLIVLAGCAITLWLIFAVRPADTGHRSVAPAHPIPQSSPTRTPNACELASASR